MRNDDNRAAEGPQPDDGTSEVYASAMSRRSRRRKLAVAGAAGLAAILGGGAFLLTDALTDEPKTTTSEVAALAPQAAPASVAPSASDGSSSAVRRTPASPAAQRATPAPSQKPKTFRERLTQAREANEKAGTTPRNPLRPTNGVITPAAVTVQESGSVRKDGRSLRVMSARSDLTGQRELAWVAGKGERVGTARCSQNFQLSNSVKPKVRPTLLVCWRTSATKSVYTVSVDVKRPPSKQASVAAIDEAWAKLS